MTMLGTELPKGMSFLEAKQVLDRFQGGQPLAMYLGTSGTGAPLATFLRAEAAHRGYSLDLRFSPFGNLMSSLEPVSNDAELEVFILFPWDLLPEADWRTGVSAETVPGDRVASEASRVLQRLISRPRARLLYVAAPTPPLAPNAEQTAMIQARLAALALGSGALAVDPKSFSLSGYLASGWPFRGASAGGLATLILEVAIGRVREPRKLLVTDFDNTLWAGVLSEDGETGIAYHPEGRGFKHFLYQTALRRLRTEGVMLAGVTRNSASVVGSLFKTVSMVLGENDFVAIVPSYEAKSAQIAAIARRMNLGLEAVVFVDDNDVELEEVSRALPQVHGCRFPARDDDIAALLDQLADLFGRDTVTGEDRERTELYRRRLEGMVPETAAGADIHDFLQSLEMRLHVTDRTQGERARAVQLINKTNQFNLNGRRWTDDEIGSLLASGGRLICGTLTDRSGSHGEILALLLGPDDVVEAWVMSCRVFNRRVEFAFVMALADSGVRPRSCRFKATDRNEPIQQFLTDAAFRPTSNGTIAIDLDTFLSAHARDRDLFQVQFAARDS